MAFQSVKDHDRNYRSLRNVKFYDKVVHYDERKNQRRRLNKNLSYDSNSYIFSYKIKKIYFVSDLNTEYEINAK